jgi:xylan 1,4-beta-xylosidase
MGGSTPVRAASRRPALTDDCQRQLVANRSTRIAWFELAGSQSERTHPAPAPTLPAPAWVRADAGRGHVTLDWQPVDGAVGYVVQRSTRRGGPFAIIDHGGGDVLAVPGPPYTDTVGTPGNRAYYVVSAMSSIEAPIGPPSRVAASATTATTAADAGDASSRW